MKRPFSYKLNIFLFLLPALILFIGVLLIILIAMATFRSPAVALMPDVTMKPLRSKANAIINLMGALGGIYALAAIRLLVKSRADGRADYTPVFIAVAALMALSVALLVWRVRENALRRAVEAEDYPVKNIRKA